jgi:hypothetical protein
MVEMEKLTITRRLEEFDSDKVFCRVQDTILYLQELSLKYPGKELYLSEGWVDYECNYFYIQYDDIETDAEATERIEEQKKAEELAAKRSACDSQVKALDDEIDKLTKARNALRYKI